MKILLLDIETTPHLSWHWGMWNQNIAVNQLQEPSRVLCFAAKWYGSKKTFFYRGDDILPAAHQLLSEADAVITFNGDHFDLPRLEQELWLNNMQPPAPYKRIDLYKVIRRRFRLARNKLEYVLKALGYEGKAESGGMQTWLDCMNPNSSHHQAAWRRIEKYNKRDVECMEPLYERLLPWIDNHPHFGLYGEALCNRCGSTDLRKEGFAYTRLGKYQQWQCRSCGGWSRSTQRLEGVNLQGIRE